MSSQKTEIYLGCKIIAWSYEFKVYNSKKNKEVLKKEYVCWLYTNLIFYQPLNLGECNDGRPFTSLQQSINQAKDLVNYLLEQKNNNL